MQPTTGLLLRIKRRSESEVNYMSSNQSQQDTKHQSCPITVQMESLENNVTDTDWGGKRGRRIRVQRENKKKDAGKKKNQGKVSPVGQRSTTRSIIRAILWFFALMVTALISIDNECVVNKCILIPLKMLKPDLYYTACAAHTVHCTSH